MVAGAPGLIHRGAGHPPGRNVGQPERRTHNYVRHGTLDLFAALNVATGEILAHCRSQHRAQDFAAQQQQAAQVTPRKER